VSSRRTGLEPGAQFTIRECVAATRAGSRGGHAARDRPAGAARDRA
jgi:hypothetical protein